MANRLSQLQKRKIVELRERGLGYRLIAKETGINRDTIRSFCQRVGMDKNGTAWFYCQECGARLNIIPKKKRKKFCSDACRMAWWNKQPFEVRCKTPYHHVCEMCGTEFDSARKGSKYCSTKCFADFRRIERRINETEYTTQSTDGFNPESEYYVLEVKKKTLPRRTEL